MPCQNGTFDRSHDQGSHTPPVSNVSVEWECVVEGGGDSAISFFVSQRPTGKRALARPTTQTRRLSIGQSLASATHARLPAASPVQSNLSQPLHLLTSSSQLLPSLSPLPPSNLLPGSLVVTSDDKRMADWDRDQLIYDHIVPIYLAQASSLA